MENEATILKDLGLTDGELKVYLSLLYTGTKTASQLSQETKLNRSNLYRILERLIDKKLVFSTIIKKTKYFSVTRVERIFELYKEKISSLKKKEMHIKKFIKNVEKLNVIKIPGTEFVVEVHEGVEEIKKVFEYVLDLKQEEVVYELGKEFVISNYPGLKYWFENFIKKRVKRRIRFIAIFNWHEKAKRAKSKYTKIRYANLIGMSDTAIAFYRDILLIYIMTKEKPKVILIKSNDIVLAMTSYFRFLWNKAKEM